MTFQNLYHLTDDEVRQLDQQLSKNFMNDELYCTVFPDERKRQYVLQYFFRHYIKCIKPNCHFLADSPEMNSVMIVYDTSLEDTLGYYLRMMWMNIKFIPMMIGLGSISSIKRVIHCYDMFTSRWVKQFVRGDAFHLDLFYTNEEARGKGLGTYMLEQLQSEAKRLSFDITMETHHADNLSLYEKNGFKQMLVITQEEYQLKQYCLLQRNKEVDV